MGVQSADTVLVQLTKSLQVSYTCNAAKDATMSSRVLSYCSQEVTQAVFHKLFMTVFVTAHDP